MGEFALPLYYEPQDLVGRGGRWGSNLPFVPASLMLGLADS